MPQLDLMIYATELYFTAVVLVGGHLGACLFLGYVTGSLLLRNFDVFFFQDVPAFWGGFCRPWLYTSMQGMHFALATVQRTLLKVITHGNTAV